MLAAFFIRCGTIPFMSAVNSWKSATEHKLLNAYRGFFTPGLFTFLSILFVLLGAKLMRAAIASPKSLKRRGFIGRKA